MNFQAFRDNFHHRHTWTEAAKRVLKNNLHITSEWAHLPAVQALNIAAQKGNPIFRGDQPHHRQSKRCFARP